MEITNIQVQSIVRGNKVKALMSITYDGVLCVHDVKVIEGGKGLFVAMPSRKEDGGRFLDVVHYTDKEARAGFEEAVLKEYGEYMERLEAKRAQAQN